MNNLDKAVATQLASIKRRTGKSILELAQIVKNSTLSKHGELVKMPRTDLGMGHGDANMVVHFALKSDGQSAAGGQTMMIPTVFTSTTIRALRGSVLPNSPMAAVLPYTGPSSGVLQFCTTKTPVA